MKTVVAACVFMAACSGETGTGWIPAHGTINGVITASNPAAAAPRAELVATPRGAGGAGGVGGAGLSARAFPAPAPIASLLRRALPGRPPLRSNRPLVTASSHDLIVTFRHTALGAPPVGSAALRTGGSVRAVAVAMRAHLATFAAPGARVTGVSPAILTARVRVADAADRDAVAAALRGDPAVATVSPGRFFWLERPRYARTVGPRVAGAGARTTPNDPLYPIQTWHYGLIELPRAWTITQGSSSVLVAVVDDGIRFDHPDVAPNLTSDGYDFVNAADSLPLCAGGFVTNAGDGNGYDPDPTSPASYSPDSTGTCFLVDSIGNHGLHVAGTIGAAGNDAFGATGVNWVVKIRPVRALGVAGFGEDYDIAQGILYAAGLPADDGSGITTVQASPGARIINLSLGGPGDDTTMHNAIKSAASAGVLVVAAAGNEGSATPHFPAAYPEVLSVAAVGPDGAPASYSSFGPFVGIRAPGGNFELGDATDGVFSTIWNFASSFPEYAWIEGTSMATPHVSGVAALLLAHEPRLTAAALRTRLTQYAVGGATAYGAGLVNAYNSLTQTFGPPTQVYAALYSATTGAAVQTVMTDPAGAFTFTNVPDGRYLIYGGTDEGADQRIGVPGRLWGAFGGSAFPQAITVLSAGPYAVSFPLGFPAQVQPNHTLASANVLAIGGYARSTYVDTTQFDFYRVTVPAPGTYTFETSGWVAACGIALEEATALFLYDASGNRITFTIFIDQGNLNFCSRLTASLNRGTYYIGVLGAFEPGRYQLQARAGQ